MNILIIGGTGFLGSHIVKKLLPKKYNLYILTRNPEKEMYFDRSKVTFIKGDISNLDFLNQLPLNLGIIVYVAMPPFKPGRLSKTKLNNLKHLTETYIKNTIKITEITNSLLILTLGASYETKHNDVADESWKITRKGMTKIGEFYDGLIADIINDRKIKLIEMLPGQIYGNGGLFQKMIDMANSNKLFILGNGHNKLPRIHVEDCADAFLLAIEKQPIGERYIICDDKSCTVNEFMNYLAQIFETKKVINIPNIILRFVLGKFLYHTVTMNSVVSNNKIKKELGWEPKYPSYIEGLKSLENLKKGK